MNHSIELVESNVVIVANDFNVTILNKIWLYKNGIFTEDELKQAIDIPFHVEVRTENFNLNIVPNKLQFIVNPKYPDAKKSIIDKLGKIVKELPHTPFTAVGLNFTYHIKPEKDDIHNFTKSLFCNDSVSLFKDLNNEDVRFGGYFSQDLMGTRFRLDAKPIKISKDGSFDEKLQFAHNFNVNLKSENAVHDILELFNKWDDAKKYTQELTEKINQ